MRIMLSRRAPKRVSVFLPSQIASDGRCDGFGIDVPVDAIPRRKPVGQFFFATARITRPATTGNIARLQMRPVKWAVIVQMLNRSAIGPVLWTPRMSQLFPAIHAVRIARANW